MYILDPESIRCKNSGRERERFSERQTERDQGQFAHKTVKLRPNLERKKYSLMNKFERKTWLYVFILN